MRNTLSLLLLPLLTLPLLGARPPQEPRPAPGQRPAQEGRERRHHEEEDTELSRHMETIEHAAKRMRRSLKDETLQADALKELAEIQSETLACKLLIPAATAKLPEAERDAFVKAYRHQMIDFLARQLELEAALIDGNAEGIKTAFDRFREMEDPSHERFAPEDD